MSDHVLGTPNIRQFSLDDCIRALFCADAVHQQSNTRVEDFLKERRKEWPALEFGDVYVSLDLRPKFLVAQSYDATYIAIRGSADFNDVVGGLELSPSLHEHLAKLAEEFMGTEWRMLLELMNSSKRIIFCGHRLGGTLAHVIVLQFWKNLMSVLKVGAHKFLEKSMISVAFGAPYMFHKMYRVEMEKYLKSSDSFYDKYLSGIKTRFFDFAHEEDPALDSILRIDYEDLHNEDQGSSDQSTGGHDGEEGTEMVECQLRDYVLDPGRNDWFSNRSSRTKKQPHSRGLGENIYLLKGNYKQTRSKSKQWTQQDFRQHYTSALILDESLFEPMISPEPRLTPLHLNVSTPEPTVSSVIRNTSDKGHSYITITGKHLLFLRGPVRVDGIYPCETKMQTDTRIIIDGPNAENVSGSLITISTAFGGISHHIKLENMSDGSGTPVRRLLRKTVQTLVILATPPLCWLGKDSKLLEDLDTIVQCVPNLVGDEKFSAMLKKIAVRDASSEELDENIQKTTSLAEAVVDFLARGYHIQYDESFNYLPLVLGGITLALSGLLAMPAVGIYTLAGGLYASTAAEAVTGALTGGAASLAVGGYLHKEGFTITDYQAVLKLAINEASLWQKKGQTPSKSPINERTEAELESLLLSEVERSGSYWRKMMKMTRDKSEGIVLCSEVFKGTTPETKRNLLRRMEIVTMTLCAYNRDLSLSKFVGIVGAENAGKSTFIKKAIEHYGRKDDENFEKDLPKVGIDLHTTVVRPYKLKDKLWLVDFPGSNGTEKYADAWKQFTALPSSCILLLDFKDRIKEPQRQMYKNMKKELVSDGGGSKITVVFNKVDKKFSSNTEQVYNEEYFDNQREAAAHHLECKMEDVYFACLHPYPKDKLTKLRNFGVLGFEELAQRVLCLSE